MKKPKIYKTWLSEAEDRARCFSGAETRINLNYWLDRLRVLRNFSRPSSPQYLARLQLIRRRIAIHTMALEQIIDRPHWYVVPAYKKAA